MIFKQCPICGRYMTPNMSETSGRYQCVCGYDTRSYSYTYSNYSSDFGDGEHTPDCPFCVRYGTDECLKNECKHLQSYKESEAEE